MNKNRKDKIQWYHDSVNKAGVDFANTSSFSEETSTLFSKPLVEIKSFVEMANLNWEIEDETKSKE